MPIHPEWPPVRRREIFGWAMFDFANSSYTTIIVTVAFSVFFTKLVAPGNKADWLWSLGITVSNLLVVLSAPIVGAVADDSGRKKLFLGATYLVCVLGTTSLYFVTPGAAILALCLFVVSNIAYAMGENFAGSFLPEISTSANIGRISGFGWGLGYFGGLASLMLVKPLLDGGFGADNFERLRLAWPLTGVFFLVAGLPTFLLLRERAVRGPRRSLSGYARAGFARLVTTARSIRQFSELARFLAIFYVFSCGLLTIVAFAAIFAERTLGFTGSELILLFLVLQVASAAGAIFFGWMQDRLGARTTLQIALVLWIGVSLGSYWCTSKPVFWGIGVAAGLGIGSLQSASRAMVGLFSPPSKSAEFFGFWGLAAKAAYASGPALFGIVSSVSGSQRLAILVNTAFFIVGLFALATVNEGRGRAAAEAWEATAAAPATG